MPHASLHSVLLTVWQSKEFPMTDTIPLEQQAATEHLKEKAGIFLKTQLHQILIQHNRRAQLDTD